MRPSRLITGTLKYRAVAATIRSGMSGISERGTWRIVSTTSLVNGASLRTKSGSLSAFLNSSYGRFWQTAFLYQIDNLGKTDRRERDVVTGTGSVVHKPSRGGRETRILEQVPKRRVGVGN